MSDYIHQSKLEHRFWLQILGDHSRFIFLNLAPVETELLNTSAQFITVFDMLLTEARSEMTAPSWMAFAQRVVPAVQALKNFKLEILRRHLAKKVMIGLAPSFFNHMLNELGEYLQNLGCLARGLSIPPKSPVHHHLLWILDAEGHAETLHCGLDDSQTKLRMKAKTYKELWEKKYGEAQEFAGFLRTCMTVFPSLGAFNKIVTEEMCGFSEYLDKVRREIAEAKALGVLPVLIPDHMLREECYFLHQLHMSDPANVPMPACDPTRPRME